jgi:subtilase family serine protease
MPSHFRLTLLTAAIGMAAIASANATSANSHAFVALNQYATQLRQGDVVSGPLAASQPIHLEVALKLRNPDQLHTFLATAKSSTLSMVQHKLSSQQFAASYAPTADQANEVAAWLTSAGFSNVKIAPNRLMVSADGRADTAQAAFKTSFAKVRTKEGRMAFMNNSGVQIPAALQDSVLSVIGLQNVHQAHTFAKRAQAGYGTQAITGHNPTEFSSIYGGSGLPTAAGVTVGIVTQGSIAQTITDLNTFTSQNGLPTVTTQTVNTNGTSTDTSGVDEWNLDSQDVVGMAGGQVGKIIFYNIPSLSNADLTADFNTIVSANATKIINVSLGECETYAQQDGSAAADDQIFQQAIAQGQTFSVSTGDSGADECGDGGTTPSDPASSPYVVAVGGTTLNASTTTYTSETAWSGGGGSVSKFEPKPTWQAGVLSGSFRGVPDIAFDGDPNSGAKIIVNGASTQVGGTSLSAPLFAGSWARLLATHPSLGFAAPYLYQTLTAADYHDVTSGSNGGETATVGWDLTTGFGSFKLSQVAADIGGGGGNVPPVANFSDSISGLTVNFTDSSTDSDGSIASRSWNFGDGGTSTATNPSHTYSAAGTYTVSLQVTDNGGATNTKTQSVTVSSGGSSQLLGNTGFESGTASPWTISTGVLCSNSTCAGEVAHAGSWFTWLDGYGTTHTDTVSQTVAIPSGKTSATLSYNLHIDTSETTTTTAYDKLKVQVFNSSGTLLKTLVTYSNLNANSGYTVHTNSLAAYIGQTVTLKFTGTEDSSLQTSFVLDDITLTVQ